MRAEIGDVHGWPVRTFFEIRRRPGDMYAVLVHRWRTILTYTYIVVIVRFGAKCGPLDASKRPNYGPLGFGRVRESGS